MIFERTICIHFHGPCPWFRGQSEGQVIPFGVCRRNGVLKWGILRDRRRQIDRVRDLVRRIDGNLHRRLIGRAPAVVFDDESETVRPDIAFVGCVFEFTCRLVQLNGTVIGFFHNSVLDELVTIDIDRLKRSRVAAAARAEGNRTIFAQRCEVYLLRGWRRRRWRGRLHTAIRGARIDDDQWWGWHHRGRRCRRRRCDLAAAKAVAATVSAFVPRVSPTVSAVVPGVSPIIISAVFASFFVSLFATFFRSLFVPLFAAFLVSFSGSLIAVFAFVTVLAFGFRGCVLLCICGRNRTVRHKAVTPVNPCFRLYEIVNSLLDQLSQVGHICLGFQDLARFVIRRRHDPHGVGICDGRNQGAVQSLQIDHTNNAVGIRLKGHQNLWIGAIQVNLDVDRCAPDPQGGSRRFHINPAGCGNLPRDKDKTALDQTERGRVFRSGVGIKNQLVQHHPRPAGQGKDRAVDKCQRQTPFRIRLHNVILEDQIAFAQNNNRTIRACDCCRPRDAFHLSDGGLPAGRRRIRGRAGIGLGQPRVLTRARQAHDILATQDGAFGRDQIRRGCVFEIARNPDKVRAFMRNDQILAVFNIGPAEHRRRIGNRDLSWLSLQQNFINRRFARAHGLKIHILYPQPAAQYPQATSNQFARLTHWQRTLTLLDYTEISHLHRISSQMRLSAE